MTSGIEWNYRFNSLDDKKNFCLFYDTFVELFENHSIVINDDEDTKIEVLFQPRGAQIEALYALEDSKSEGATKGLVQAATGVGKTYLAAFDSAKYERVLFVAHREEILKQAAISFKNVRHSDDYGFFYGKQKDIDKAVIFASVVTLGKNEYLTEDFLHRIISIM